MLDFLQDVSAAVCIQPPMFIIQHIWDHLYRFCGVDFDSRASGVILRVEPAFAGSDEAVMVMNRPSTDPEKGQDLHPLLEQVVSSNVASAANPMGENRILRVSWPESEVLTESEVMALAVLTPKKFFPLSV